LVYHLICQSEKIKISKAEPSSEYDFIKQISGKFFSASLETDPSHMFYGKGGRPSWTFHRIFQALSISCAELLDDKVIQYDKITNHPFEDNTVEHPFKLLNEKSDMPDVLLFRRMNKNLKKEEKINGVKYIAQCAYISFSWNDEESDGPSEHSHGHAVAGIFCNGQPMIFDSATGFLCNGDWLNLNGDEYKKWFKSVMEEWSIRKLKHFNTDPVYIKYDTYQRLLSNPPICKLEGAPEVDF
jgi:hypothetical protein